MQSLLFLMAVFITCYIGRGCYRQSQIDKVNDVKRRERLAKRAKLKKDKSTKSESVLNQRTDNKTLAEI